MVRPRLLDLFCGAGGAGEGYARAGFDVVGVDLLRKSSNPHPRIVQDVLTLEPWQLAKFDAIHASPPCKAHSCQSKSLGIAHLHDDLIPQVRTLLQNSSRPWVIENVPGSSIPGITLCGSMFPGHRVRRHRLFESNCLLYAPPCGEHKRVWSNTNSDDWRAYREGRVDPWKMWCSVVGNTAPVDNARDAMQIDWMTGAELSQSIPPAYTEYIGRQLLEFV